MRTRVHGSDTERGFAMSMYTVSQQTELVHRCADESVARLHSEHENILCGCRVPLLWFSAVSLGAKINVEVAWPPSPADLRGSLAALISKGDSCVSRVWGSSRPFLRRPTFVIGSVSS